MTQVNEQVLNELIKKSQTADLDSFTPTNVTSLIHAFILPTPSIIRSKAYVLLSALCQKAHGPKGHLADEEGTERLSKFFGPHIIQCLNETDDSSLRVGICTLHALFQVDWPSAAAILSEEGIVENIMEGLDLSRSVQLEEDVAHLLGQASGHKRCREIIPEQAVRWLEAKSQQASNSSLRAAAAVALIKHSRGASADAPDITTVKPDNSSQDVRLADMMKELVISGKNRDTLSDAIEALAYLSTTPEIKETLSSDSSFLRQLFSLVPRKKAASVSTDRTVESTLVYGVLVIISNICAYPPRLSEEQAQLEKLKRMAQSTKRNLEIAETSPLESNASVGTRVRRLVDAGALDVFSFMSTTSDSLAVRLQLGKTLLYIVEDKENRGKVLQTGGAKTLSILIKHALSTLTSKERTLDTAYLESIQALTKLAITSSPLQVFGPDIGAVFDAIRPFSILLQHHSSTLLQKFEANMALTNLSSYHPQVAERIAQMDGLLSRVELLMLEDHVLVRRSAVELICNLISGSDQVFELYGGGANSPNAKSKLQILVALADVDDLSTALAASGALAALTCSPHACRNIVLLQQEHRRVISVLTQLIDPSAAVFLNDDEVDDNRTNHENSGLVHRGVVCARNLLKSIDDAEMKEVLLKDSQSTGLMNALVRLVKGEGITKEQMILMPAAEALKSITEGGTRHYFRNTAT